MRLGKDPVVRMATAMDPWSHAPNAAQQNLWLAASAKQVTAGKDRH